MRSMVAPVFQTKLVIPPSPTSSVPRPRLIGQLNLGVQQGHRLLLITAPPGYGKATLQAWLSKLPHAAIAARQGATPLSLISPFAGLATVGIISNMRLLNVMFIFQGRDRCHVRLCGESYKSLLTPLIIATHSTNCDRADGSSLGSEDR